MHCLIPEEKLTSFQREISLTTQHLEAQKSLWDGHVTSPCPTNHKKASSNSMNSLALMAIIVFSLTGALSMVRGENGTKPNVLKGCFNSGVGNILNTET